MNPLPGLTPGYSDLCLIASAAGIEYRTLIGEILEGGLKRLREKRREAKTEARTEVKPDAKPDAAKRTAASPPATATAPAPNAQRNGVANGSATAQRRTARRERPVPRSPDSVDAGSGMRKRLRELGFSIGRFPVGESNAITDVAGVKVGHTTLIIGDGPLDVGKGPVRTGVTAIIPNADVFESGWSPAASS